MPRRDATGPWGMGPLTGRGFGPCGRGYGYGAGYRAAGGWRRGGRGYGPGPGYGAGFGPGVGPGYAPGYGPGLGYMPGVQPAYGYGWGVEGLQGAATPEAHRQYLKEHKEMLEEQLAWIDRELETDKDD